MSNVYLVTTGDGTDGDEWNVHGIFATQQAADTFVREASRNCCYEVEEWGVHGSAFTAEEREAIKTAIATLAAFSYPTLPAAADTLRTLLERLT